MSEEHPDARLNILIVWLKMYPSDSIDRVKRAARLFSDDSRVTQFYDPGKIVGQEVAKGLGAESGQIAWDVYLFYAQDDRWLAHIPTPIDWAHQLKGSTWAEPGRLSRGDQLTNKLREIVSNFLQNEGHG
jgi:hypothetical protein